MTAATLTRSDDTLVFAGVLDQAAAAALWPRALALLAGAQRLDLIAVPNVDSAGLALLAELADRMGPGVTLSGCPAGLEELRTAYRLHDNLSFAS